MPRLIKSLWDIAGEDLYKKIMSPDYVPEQTERAYKMFRTDGEELYPLFVDSKTPVPVGEWQRAISGDSTAGGKVKSKIGPLAYRPGWHAGDNAAATHIGAKSDSSLKAPDTRRPEHVWAEIDMADDVDWQTYANNQGTQPRTKHVTDTVPYGGQYRYKTNSNMDGDWHIGGDMRVNRVLSDREVAEINREHGLLDLERREPSSYLEDIYKKYGAVGGATTAGLAAAGQSEDADAGFVTKGGKTLLEAFHGSPHKFDKFSMDQIGTGEGAQRYGHGLYFADSEDVARGYRDSLAGSDGYYNGQRIADMGLPTESPEVRALSHATGLLRDGYTDDVRADTLAYFQDDLDQWLGYRADLKDDPDALKHLEVEITDRKAALEAAKGIDYSAINSTPNGHLYRTEIDVTPESLLDWDAMLDEQPKAVQEAIESTDWWDYAAEDLWNGADNPTGGSLVRWLSDDGPEFGSQQLNDAGIKGIKYLDGDSRAAGDGTSNYVIFDDSLINIAERGNADPRLLAGTAAGTAGLLGALGSEDAEAGVSFGLAKNVDLDRLISAWRKAVSRDPDINPSTHLQNIIHNKEFTNYNDWTQYARKADGGKNGDTYFNELKPFLLDISKHPSVAKDNRLRRGLVDYADTRFAQRKKQGHVADRQRGEADPYSLLPVAGVGAAAASLTAPYMKDSGIASPVRSETLGDITMGLRGLERNLRGSPMSLLFPEGLTNYLETVNRETEDPNMMTRAMALLDVMP